MGLPALEARGDTLSFLCPPSFPSGGLKVTGEGPEQEGGTGVPKQSFGLTPPPRGEMRGKERKK